MIKMSEMLLKKISKIEKIDSKELKQLVESGKIVIPKNKKRKVTKMCAIGKGVTTKVNANIGLSPESSNIKNEIEKMKIAIDAGADTIMDLSVGAGLDQLREKILSICSVPVGTVPVYDLVCKKKEPFFSMKEDSFINVLQHQAEQGVDFFTIHAGITLDSANYIVKNNPRILNIVSRGGAFLASWMVQNQKENPFLSRFDDVLEILSKYNIVLSLGDSLRPGAICDATDKLQIQELLLLGDLQKRALKKGVQVIIEGPGHVPINQIETNVKLQKSICNDAPFYVLGPLVTDIAPGYDHIVGAIGGAIAAWHGADFLCYVTPAEHLCLPDLKDVEQGVIASKIAAHAADIGKGIPFSIDLDKTMSKARLTRDWNKQFEISIDKKNPKKIRNISKPHKKDVCTMCSEYCSIKIVEKLLKT